MTNETEPRSLKTILLKDWPSRLILTVLTGFAGIAWSQGEAIIQKKVLDIVQPYLDTLAKKQESTEKKVDNVDDKMNALIQIMSKAFPEFKKAAKERVQENNDSRDVQDALTGGTK